MATVHKQFSDKYNTLSSEIQFYFNNEFSGRQILDLAASYKVDAEYVYDLVFDAVNFDFDLNNLRKELTALNLTGPAEQNFFRDFIGKILLPIAPYITTNDIKEALVKNGGNPELYQNDIDNFLSLIDQENIKACDELIALHDKVVDLKEEKEYSLDIMANHLIEALTAEGREATISLNGGLIYLLYNSKNFNIEATQVLLNNSNILTSQALYCEEKEAAPTVANWLKDFIKVNGSDMFDEIVLAEYLTNSENVKKLNAEEKKLVRKLLKLYKNLVFFPDSLENVPIENWEIFPLDPSQQEEVKPTVEPVKTETLKKPEPVTPEPPKKPEPLSPDQQIIQELESSLPKYSPDSFEYKAISQEIKRLQKKSLKK